MDVFLQDCECFVHDFSSSIVRDVGWRCCVAFLQNCESADGEVCSCSRGFCRIAKVQIGVLSCLIITYFYSVQ